MKIAVLGYGTVGSGVVEVLDVNQKLIATLAKEEIEFKYLLDLRDFPGDKIQEKIVHDYEIILNDPEIGIEWPQVKGEYLGNAVADGYELEDGTKLNLSEKDQKWLGLADTFKF